MKDLYIRATTIKLLEDNTRGKLQDTGLENDFLDINTKRKSNKRKQQMNWT